MNNLVDVFLYNSITGKIYWKVNRGNVKAGSEAGTLHPNGYVMVVFNKRSYPAHRLAWFLHTGEWPKGTIDHINHCKSDNSLSNLRDVPQSTNQKNKSKSSKNTSGVTGVCYHKTRKKWYAMIIVDYKRIHIGYYNSLEEAALERLEAELFYDFSTTHGK